MPKSSYLWARHNNRYFCWLPMTKKVFFFFFSEMCVLISKCLRMLLISGLWSLTFIFFHPEKKNRFRNWKAPQAQPHGDICSERHLHPSVCRQTCTPCGPWIVTLRWDKRLLIYIRFLKYSIKRIISQEAGIEMASEGIWCAAAVSEDFEMNCMDMSE